ncbi:MAG: hypothetical protein V1681_07175 [Candidatus Neomarinimicrobiota bacterium]
MKKMNSLFRTYWLIFILIIATITPAFSYDYLVEKLESIVRRSTDIFVIKVLDIKQSIDEHNAPIRIVKMKVNEILFGKSIDSIIVLNFPIIEYEGVTKLVLVILRNGTNLIPIDRG